MQPYLKMRAQLRRDFSRHFQELGRYSKWRLEMWKWQIKNKYQQVQTQTHTQAQTQTQIQQHKTSSYHNSIFSNNVITSPLPLSLRILFRNLPTLCYKITKGTLSLFWKVLTISIFPRIIPLSMQKKIQYLDNQRRKAKKNFSNKVEFTDPHFTITEKIRDSPRSSEGIFQSLYYKKIKEAEDAAARIELKVKEAKIFCEKSDHIKPGSTWEKLELVRAKAKGESLERLKGITEGSEWTLKGDKYKFYPGAPLRYENKDGFNGEEEDDEKEISSYKKREAMKAQNEKLKRENPMWKDPFLVEKRQRIDMYIFAFGTVFLVVFYILVQPLCWHWYMDNYGYKLLPGYQYTEEDETADVIR